MMLTPKLLEEGTRMVVRAQFAASSTVRRRLYVSFATACADRPWRTRPLCWIGPTLRAYGPDQLEQALARATGQAGA